MNSSIPTISIFNLSLMVIPVIAVAVIYYRWVAGYRMILYAFLRMVGQLILIGYVLTYLFAFDNVLTLALVVLVMIGVSSWIALYPLKRKSAALYGKVTLAIAIGGCTTLAFTTQLVLELAPWFSVKYMIPLAGMTFSNAMNTVCLAAERFESEAPSGERYEKIRNAALQAAMIPTVNSLFAVGLVSLPGVMTGQILSGVSPLVAVRYQIMIMCLLLGAAGVSTAIYLALMRSSRLLASRLPSN